MTKKPKVLVVDDELFMREMLARALEPEYDVETCEAGEQAVGSFRRRAPDVVLTDIRMPDVDGMQVLQTVKSESPDTEVILMTGYASVPQAVEAMKAGAYDYVTKPFEPEELKITVEKAVELKRLREEAQILKEQVEKKYGLPNIVGDSEPMQRTYELARKAAACDVAVLLTGESGTGKELFARAIHYTGERRARRFVAINCAAMPKELIESELFGHVRGAFSGATRDKRGLFTVADGGSLFLDEISQLDPDLQVKINRAIQEKEIRPVGDTVDIPVDVRIIAATNRDLKAAMEQRQFREDLYYRLNVFPIHLPPLRERVGDVPLLMRHFLRLFADERAEDYEVEPAALELLMGYSWPGNVRELRNAVERAVVLCEGGRITPSLFPFIEPDTHQRPLEAETMAALPYREAMERMVQRCQRQYLAEVLKKCGGDVARAAERAGIKRESFYRRMRKCGLDADEVRRQLVEE